jgi:hypothetical protein
MFKKINRLIWYPLKWYPLTNSERDFVTDKYSKDECYLRMNDFPDEPLWTLFYKGDSIDFDDTPSIWHIAYRSNK